jgi:hypothetical protein
MDVGREKAEKGGEKPVRKHEIKSELDQNQRLEREVNIEVREKDGKQQGKEEPADERVRQDAEEFHGKKVT